MYISEEEAKRIICDIGRKMYEKQMVAANDGNITLRVGENTAIVTPTGVSKGDLTPDMLLKVDFDGNVLEGTYKPTSEIFMHLNVYKHNPEAVSTCHAHPIFSSIFAIAGIEADLSTTPAAIMISGRLPVVPYECPGTKELADSVIPYVNDYSAVLLANHGPLTWGRGTMDAWFCMEEVENCCKISLFLKYLVKDFRPIAQSQIAVLEKNVYPLGDKKRMTAPEEISNRIQGVPLSGIRTDKVSLDDESLKRLALLLKGHGL